MLLERNVSEMVENYGHYKLCYIEYSHIYFTDAQDIEHVYGDDWDDAPYEHNAGEPYAWNDGKMFNDMPMPSYDIIYFIYSSSSFLTPAELADSNSRYSVEDITYRKLIPWLTPKSYPRTYQGERGVALWGGDAFRDVVRELLKMPDTNIYFPVK